MSAVHTRLEGFVLISAEPQDSAAFYAWLLHTNALKTHGVLAVEPAAHPGPGPSWVPVFSVTDRDIVGARAARVAPGLDGAAWSYIADPDEIWTGVVDEPIESSGPGRSNVDYLSTDTAGTAATYGRLLDLKSWAVVEDSYDFHFLVGNRRAAAGVVRFRTAANITPPRGWLVYHDVPDIADAVERALEANCRLVIPIGTSPFNRFAVLLDPFGTPFGLSQPADAGSPPDLKVQDSTGSVVAADEVVEALL